MEPGPEPDEHAEPEPGAASRWTGPSASLQDETAAQKSLEAALEQEALEAAVMAASMDGSFAWVTAAQCTAATALNKGAGGEIFKLTGPGGVCVAVKQFARGPLSSDPTRAHSFQKEVTLFSKVRDETPAHSLGRADPLRISQRAHGCAAGAPQCRPPAGCQNRDLVPYADHGAG